jgi:hypothetical protein
MYDDDHDDVDVIPDATDNCHFVGVGIGPLYVYHGDRDPD